jgi:phage terminase small subunit
MPILKNPRYERFAQELASGKTAEQSYSLAGYAPNRGNFMQLKANESIMSRVRELLDRGAKRAELDREWVLSRLMENANRAMQAQQVLDSEGKPIGEFRYNGAVANRALDFAESEATTP